jgi:hypothetical protein
VTGRRRPLDGGVHLPVGTDWLSGTSGGGGGGIAISAGAASQSTGTVIFANSNGVSFGLNAGTLTANTEVRGAPLYHLGTTFLGSSSAAAGTTHVTENSVWVAGAVTMTVQTLDVGGGGTSYLYRPYLFVKQTVSGSNGSFSYENGLTFQNSNGVSFYTSNSAIVASHNGLTTAAQSDHSHGNPTLNLTNLAGTTASGSAGFTLSLSHNISTAALSNHTHGNPTLALTNLTGTTASASNGLTLSLSAAAQGAGSGTGLNLTNLTGTLSANTAGVSLSLSAAAPGAGGGFAAQGSGAYTQNTGTIQFANSNGITFGLSTNQMTASHNGLTTAAQSNHSHGNPTLALTNLTGTTASSSNGFTLSLSAAAPGGGAGATLSYFEPIWAQSGRATNSSLGQNTLYFQPFDLPFYLSASRINFYISISGAMTAANSTGTCQQGFGYALYTRDMTGAASQTLSLLTSYSVTHLSHSFTSNTQYQATHYFGLSNATTHSTRQTAISATNATTYLSTNINGPRVLALPLNSVLTPGRYWLAVAVSTVTGNGMTNGLSVQMTSVGVVGAAYHFGSASAATNASVYRAQQGWGSYSATSAAFPNSVAYSTDAIRHPVAMTAVHFDIRGFGTSTNQL